MGFFRALSQSGGRLPSPSSDLPGRQPLAGQVIVFAGKLSSLGRKDARALVERLGGVTSADVNTNTTMIVIGAEGPGRSGDEPNAREKSLKLKRAEELKAQGSTIQILSEEDFCRLPGVPTPDALK